MSLNDMKNNIKKYLSLSDKDIRDFEEASDHHFKCKCELCKKWKKIIDGKYTSKNEE